MASRLQELKAKWAADKRKPEDEKPQPQSKRPKQMPVPEAPPPVAPGIGLKAGIPLGRGRGSLKQVSSGPASPTAAATATVPKAVLGGKAAMPPARPSVPLNVAKAVAPNTPVMAAKTFAPKAVQEPVITKVVQEPVVPKPIQEAAILPKAKAEAPTPAPKLQSLMTLRRKAAEQQAMPKSHADEIKEYEDWLRTNFGEEAVVPKMASTFSHTAFKEVKDYIDSIKSSHPDLFSK